VKRNVIKIDESKCVGCGLCVSACHEGAIGMVDGKAKLLREDHCDGLGRCLPSCPTEAITLEERELVAPDNKNETNVGKQVTRDISEANENEQPEVLPCGCPGTQSKAFDRGYPQENVVQERSGFVETHLNQWPIQIQLVPVNAPYFERAHLLVAADCAAYAYGNFHNDYMKNKVTIIGCPKLDEVDYAEKLTAIIKTNEIKSVTLVRMEVPCCSGIVDAGKTALQNCGKMIPWQMVTISTDGRIVD
jgi:ferredoxin